MQHNEEDRREDGQVVKGFKYQCFNSSGAVWNPFFPGLSPVEEGTVWTSTLDRRAGRLCSKGIHFCPTWDDICRFINNFEHSNQQVKVWEVETIGHVVKPERFHHSVISRKWRTDVLKFIRSVYEGTVRDLPKGEPKND